MPWGPVARVDVGEVGGSNIFQNNSVPETTFLYFLTDFSPFLPHGSAPTVAAHLCDTLLSNQCVHVTCSFTIRSDVQIIG